MMCILCFCGGQNDSLHVLEWRTVCIHFDRVTAILPERVLLWLSSQRTRHCQFVSRLQRTMKLLTLRFHQVFAEAAGEQRAADTCILGAACGILQL